MSAQWSGPELELARPPARQGRYIGPGTVLVWLLLGAVCWLPILFILYLWSVI